MFMLFMYMFKVPKNMNFKKLNNKKKCSHVCYVYVYKSFYCVGAVQTKQPTVLNYLHRIIEWPLEFFYYRTYIENILQQIAVFNTDLCVTWLNFKSFEEPLLDGVTWWCHFLCLCQSLMESWSDDSWNCCHNRRNTGHSDTSVYHSCALLL